MTALEDLITLLPPIDDYAPIAAALKEYADAQTAISTAQAAIAKATKDAEAAKAEADATASELQKTVDEANVKVNAMQSVVDSANATAAQLAQANGVIATLKIQLAAARKALATVQPGLAKAADFVLAVQSLVPMQQPVQKMLASIPSALAALAEVQAVFQTSDPAAIDAQIAAKQAELAALSALKTPISE